jgi:hypothetical protein
LAEIERLPYLLTNHLLRLGFPHELRHATQIDDRQRDPARWPNELNGFLIDRLKGRTQLLMAADDLVNRSAQNLRIDGIPQPNCACKVIRGRSRR